MDILILLAFCVALAVLGVGVRLLIEAMYALKQNREEKDLNHQIMERLNKSSREDLFKWLEKIGFLSGREEHRIINLSYASEYMYTEDVGRAIESVVHNCPHSLSQIAKEMCATYSQSHITEIIDVFSRHAAASQNLARAVQEEETKKMVDKAAKLRESREI